MSPMKKIFTTVAAMVLALIMSVTRICSTECNKQHNITDRDSWKCYIHKKLQCSDSNSYRRKR